MTKMGLSTRKMSLNTPKWVSTPQNGSQHVQNGSQHPPKIEVLRPMLRVLRPQKGCRDPFWGHNTHKQVSVETQTNGSQHLVSTQNGSLNMPNFSRKKNQQGWRTERQPLNTMFFQFTGAHECSHGRFSY